MELNLNSRPFLCQTVTKELEHRFGTHQERSNSSRLQQLTIDLPLEHSLFMM